MNNTSPMLTAAQFWAGRGFPVFPIRPNLKTPATANGLTDAALDPQQIEKWFSDGRYNIAVLMGKGYVGIDIDIKKDVDGRIALADLVKKYGELPETFTVSTPSGGVHYYFASEEASKIKSRNGFFGEGIDIKSHGGYLVAPPSHLEASADPTGKNVTGDYTISKRVPFATLPEPWVKFLMNGRDNPPPQQRYAEPSHDQRLTEIQGALAYIDATPHDEWVKVGMALHSLGDDGLNLWDTWSRNAPNYDTAEIPKRWKSFAGSSVKVETVFYMAAQNGWQNPAKGRKPEPQQSTNRTHQQQQDHHHRHSVEPDLDHVKLISGNSITPRQMEWVWQYWLPKGKLSLLVGAPKTGKTLLAIDLAATITSGGNFPDGTRADKSTVIFWTAEDDLDDTIVPRFKAAGGDLANVRFIDHTMSSGRGQPFNPAVDMPLLKDAISRMDKPPALLILDPVVSVTPDMNNASTVRMSLAPVVELAQAHGMAVLGITHFRKSSAESGNLSERILGSQAFLAVARMVWFAMKPPDMDSSRLFFKGDTNLAESDEGFLYEVESRDAEFPEHRLTVQTAGILWGDKLDAEALQAIIKPDGKNEAAPVQVEAEEFLKRFLATGARLKKEIDDEADNQGITSIALRRAKKSLGIQHRKRRGDSKSEWYFAELDQQLDQTHTPKKVDQVDQVERVVNQAATQQLDQTHTPKKVDQVERVDQVVEVEVFEV